MSRTKQPGMPSAVQAGQHATARAQLSWQPCAQGLSSARSADAHKPSVEDSLQGIRQAFERKEYGRCLAQLGMLDRALDSAAEVPLLDLVTQRKIVQIHLDGSRQLWDKVSLWSYHLAVTPQCAHGTWSEVSGPQQQFTAGAEPSTTPGSFNDPPKVQAAGPDGGSWRFSLTVCSLHLSSAMDAEAALPGYVPACCPSINSLRIETSTQVSLHAGAPRQVQLLWS